MPDIKTEKDIRSILIDQIIEVDQLYLNVTQQVIITTEDKIKLSLSKHFKKAERRREWITPFTLLIAIITVFVTSDFKEYFFTADTWRAIFLLLAIGAFMWLSISLRYAFRKSKIEDIIDEIKLGDKPKPAKQSIRSGAES